MRNIILRRLLLLGIFVLTIVSCDSDSNESVITSFEKFPVTSETNAITVSENDAGIYTFNFVLDERQITDMDITIGVGGSSTATEGVDFELETTDVELAAFEGREGFSVDVNVLQDYEIEDGDETIYLVFSSTTPSGLEKSETLVITIEDSGVGPQPAPTADFTLRWEFSDPLLSGADVCDIIEDLDLTIQTQGGAPYDDDLLGYAAATLSCPESGTLTIADMNDGEVYDVWVMIYAGVDYGDLSGLTVYIDYARETSDFNGTLTIDGVFDSNMADDSAIVGTIVRNGDVLTLKNSDGDVIGSGRISNTPKLHKVKKPEFLLK